MLITQADDPHKLVYSPYPYNQTGFIMPSLTVISATAYEFTIDSYDEASKEHSSAIFVVKGKADANALFLHFNNAYLSDLPAILIRLNQFSTTGSLETETEDDVYRKITLTGNSRTDIIIKRSYWERQVFMLVW